MNCPQDRAHGRLLSWNSPKWAFFCPHVGHVGRRFYEFNEVRP